MCKGVAWATSFRPVVEGGVPPGYAVTATLRGVSTNAAR
jgi:hypothetical protein